MSKLSTRIEVENRFNSSPIECKIEGGRIISVTFKPGIEKYTAEDIIAALSAAGVHVTGFHMPTPEKFENLPLRDWTGVLKTGTFKVRHLDSGDVLFPEMAFYYYKIVK